MADASAAAEQTSNFMVEAWVILSLWQNIVLSAEIFSRSRTPHAAFQNGCLDVSTVSTESSRVFSVKIQRRYFEAWLRRTGKQLAVSGRLTQVAIVLAAEKGGSVEDWRLHLRCLLTGEKIPSLELLTRIDCLLAEPRPTREDPHRQGSLF